jgi:NADPH-dependent glutamate synthase beta subunit-like oxidoreductase
VVIIGAGNSAMQIAPRVAHVARDVTILANKYVGLYPQETSDRFGWRAQSQLACEMIAKTVDRCNHDWRSDIGCLRYIVYDEIDAGKNDELVAIYRGSRNDFAIGRCSMPAKHPHLKSRIASVGMDQWQETFPLGETVLIAATGVSPAYPEGSSLQSLKKNQRGFLIADEAGFTGLNGLFVAGGCAGRRAVNDMRSVLPDDVLRRDFASAASIPA